jgi:hypothetical protein
VLDSNLTCIVDTISSSTVVIDSKNSAGTQGYYLMEGDTFDVPAGSSPTVQTVTFDLPTRIFGMQLYATDSNVGDRLDMSLYPNTVVGVLTQPAAVGDAVFHVTPTVLGAVVPGFYLRLTDLATGATHDAGKLLSVDLAASTVTCKNPLPAAVGPLSAGTTTVDLTIYVGRGIPIPRAGLYSVGYGTMGSKPIPAGATCALTYHCADGVAKKMSYAIETTY